MDFVDFLKEMLGITEDFGITSNSLSSTYRHNSIELFGINILKAQNIKPISQSEIDAIKPEIDNLIEAKTWHWKFV